MQQPTFPITQGPSTRPTITEICAFLQSLLPVRQGDVAFDYHTPRFKSFNPTTARPSRVILSITPTAGFYDALTTAAAAAATTTSQSTTTRPTPLLAFLHRPWTLDRQRVPRSATIVASHKAFDEVLTVGNNTALAAKLGMDVCRAAVIRGYKGDPDRTIGIVGPLLETAAASRSTLRSRLQAEFGSFEGVFGFDDNGEEDRDEEPIAMCEKKKEEDNNKISCVAIMNAFHPEEVDQVAALAVGMGLASTVDDCRGVLYLTGAVREPGLEAARKRGMAVVCVGHRTCEEWGIRHLAGVLRERWPGLRVQEVFEAEEVRVVKSSSSKAHSTKATALTNTVDTEINIIK